jgi:hypothetical protein
MQLTGSKDNGWVYTEEDPGVQNGNSGSKSRYIILSALKVLIIFWAFSLWRASPLFCGPEPPPD